jgi:hypothetical protein
MVSGGEGPVAEVAKTVASVVHGREGVPLSHSFLLPFLLRFVCPHLERSPFVWNRGWFSTPPWRSSMVASFLCPGLGNLQSVL